MSPASKLQVESLVCELAETEGDCSQFVRHQSVFLLTDKLRASGIKYSIILQKPGDVIFTFPGAYLQGFNMGMNLAEAINYAPEAVGDVEGYIPCREWCNPGVDPIPAQGMLPRSARKRLPVPGPADTGARKKQRLNQGRQFVSMEMLVSRLQEAVLFRRTAIANNGNNGNNMFNNTISTKDLWRMNQADSEGILRTVERRIFRDLLTERVNELKASGSSKEMIRDDLGASGSADSVCQYLRRAQIWTEVRKIFQEELPGKECWAIFCAIAPSTSTYILPTALCTKDCLAALETMTNREKVKWLSAVEVDKQEVLALLELAIPSFMFALGYASHLPKQEFEDRIYDQSRDWETWFNE
jgi:hypothetical protein